MYRTYRFIGDGTGSDPIGHTRDVDPVTLLANRAAWGGQQYYMSGPTTARPKPFDPDFAGLGTIQRGTEFLDTTLGYVVIADGRGNWLNPATGASV